ncbi:putative fluoride ion transporter CrcB [Alteripontixanthobacter maritimus]|uniref:Fluoride-specific ion channel FluC n=1 Tax=Alteripontixanthobacter maritimus TaxID=2161824 RepID=A0A369Q498_9SPHN|nr:fluoride efflux transporter CrcB [Alteripontixanthobacter maritimus]RDC59270.1 putative fluoride ion transporter CrcB [Alteripontixanthobacter maritimus]
MSALPPIAATLYVAIGGAVGAAVRYSLGRGMTAMAGPRVMDAFPWATLTANVAGSLAMGVLVGWLARQGDGGESWRLLLGVGLLGGFTTFSSFSIEMLGLIERGQAGLAMIYAAVSVAAGLGALYLGLIGIRATA